MMHEDNEETEKEAAHEENSKKRVAAKGAYEDGDCKHCGSKKHPSHKHHKGKAIEKAMEKVKK